MYKGGNNFAGKKISGLVSITLEVNGQEQDLLYSLTEEELVQLSRDHAQDILNVAVVREVAVGYDGKKNIEVVMSL